MANDIGIRKEFASHTLATIAEFINVMSPPADTEKYTFFKVRTSDGCSLYVWGDNPEEVICRFRRFLKLYLFT